LRYSKEQFAAASKTGASHATPHERDSSAGDTSFEILQFNNVEDGAADESFSHAILVAVHADVHGASLNDGHVVVGHVKV